MDSDDAAPMDREQAARVVIQAVHELFFSAENQSKFMGAAEELGLTPPMLKSLLELEPDEAVPMRELADRWGCDASFVTVVVDGLERQGYVRREVAPRDRRIKTVKLTSVGEEARTEGIEAVYGGRAGIDALTSAEVTTLATLLTKVAEAQADYDELLVDRPDVRASVRQAAARRTREFHRHPDGGGWREHLEAHRTELRRLREELIRMRDDLKAQALGPVDDVRSELKAAKADLKNELKAAKTDAKAQVKASLAGQRRPPPGTPA
jgi:DNA-binding MarR family transcriptional regulator